MANNNQRIVWMMDESIANTRPRHWDRLTKLETSLVNSVSKNGFSHEVVSPIPCLDSLTHQMSGRKFSAIIDLAGWLSPAFGELFPNTPIIDEFSMSRVRVVNSPNLETTGYTISLSPQEISNVKSHFDFSKTLIVDDVSFSGWTSRKTMDLWNLDPENTVHAFLIANTGLLGPNEDSPMGAVPSLESVGSKVFFGHELTTPHEDGWHLKDLHMHENLERAFNHSITIQQAISQYGPESDEVDMLINNSEILQSLYTIKFTSSEIRKMEEGGKFTVLNESNLADGTVHAPNPFLWASQYFMMHVDTDKILANRGHIIDILRELKQLTSDPEGRAETIMELKRNISKTLVAKEGRLRNGKER